MRRFVQARPSVYRRDALFSVVATLAAILRVRTKPRHLGSSTSPVGSEATRLCLVLGFLCCLATHAAESRTGDGSLPIIGPRDNYVTSTACQECHPDEHASWHRSFHRTMTQLATTNSVRGAFDGTSVEAEGLIYRVFFENDRYWAEMPDPDLMMYAVEGKRKVPLEKLPRVKRPVVMSTGSHHYQTYWVSSARHPTVLHTLPLVFLLDEHRWIPREAAFLHGPDDQERFEVQWNNQCIRCHSTGGNPGLDEATGGLQTRVAELGIACEACHGPGKPHVEKQRALASGGAPAKSSGRGDNTIIQPARLASRAANEVCGQCHGEYVTRDEFAMENAKHGPLYKPGDSLHRTRYYIQHPRPGSARQRWQDLEKNPQFFRERWWPDGTILAGGREYTALRASACYLKGQISCLNCHSMHDSEPDDQLKKSGGNSRSCQECHREPKYNSELTRHTFHAAGSSGSDCLNCHMPHTSYALLKGIRSHQISSPRLDNPLRLEVPNACNLCHLDRTLAWSSEHLAKRYQQPTVPLHADQLSVAASVLWVLKGDAAQRAVTGWHYGWAPAQQISGTNWMAPILASLLDDAYGVVRQIGYKSLKTVQPGAASGYDFLSASDARRLIVSSILSNWQASSNSPLSSRSNVLVAADGKLMTNVLSRLLSEQDRRSVTVQE
ncbi:MAG: hypothetical protein JNN07_02335 [Verrucomicrobiales bacterium]|nr:hypothetical protein [Verrucomicrobiales bacterium]